MTKPRVTKKNCPKKIRPGKKPKFDDCSFCRTYKATGWFVDIYAEPGHSSASGLVRPVLLPGLRVLSCSVPWLSDCVQKFTPNTKKHKKLKILIKFCFNFFELHREFCMNFGNAPGGNFVHRITPHAVLEIGSLATRATRAATSGLWTDSYHRDQNGFIPSDLPPLVGYDLPGRSNALIVISSRDHSSSRDNLAATGLAQGRIDR